MQKIVKDKPTLSAAALSHLGFGVGLRHCHFQHVLEHKPRVDWFEIITESFIGSKSWPWHVISHLRSDFPIVPHGVSLSIGSTAPLSVEYLRAVKELSDFLEAPFVTDHLCWTGVANQNLHDLLPLPYTQESLDHVSHRVEEVMAVLGRPFGLENPSTYLRFNYSPIPEWEFLAALYERTGCGILLDLNNVFINSQNHGFDPYTYISALPKEAVIQYHLAGHTDKGSYLLDTHIGPIPTSVMRLYGFALKEIGPRPTLIEWDDQIPNFETLEDECERVRLRSRVSSRSSSDEPKLSI